MVAPVPAQISKLRHCPTPRSLRIYPLPTTHCPLSSSHPSSASRGVNIPPVLSSFRILPVPAGGVPLLPPCSGPRFLCFALFPAVSRFFFSATCSLFFSLCSFFANPTLCFQSLAASF